MTSARTKAAMAAAAFVANALPIVRKLQAGGTMMTRALAAALSDRGIRTARGGVGSDRA
jgi:hypothetical protein